MATCYRHSNRETGVSCSNCGRPICPDCMTPTSVGMRCPDCAGEKTQVRNLSSGRGRGRMAFGREWTAVTVLLAINVVAFFLEIATSEGGNVGGGEVYKWGALIGNNLFGESELTSAGGDIHNGHEYWRLITSGFLHSNELPGGLLHIGFNMYLLYIIGPELEEGMGTPRLLLLFFTSLLAGSCGALIDNPNAPTVGASGAVFGLMGGAVVAMRARGFDPMQSGIPLLIGINLLLGFAIPNVSVGGHIGGLIGGAAAAYILVEIGDRHRYRTASIFGCVALAAACVAGALAAAGG